MQKQAVKQLVEAGSDTERDGVVRWRCVDLQCITRQRNSIHGNQASVRGRLKELVFTYFGAGPRHPRQKPQAIEALEKLSSAQIVDNAATRASDTPIELRFADEMRVLRTSGQLIMTPMVTQACLFDRSHRACGFPYQLSAAKRGEDHLIASSTTDMPLD